MSAPDASELAAAVGRALYGDDRAAPTASALDVNLHTLQRIKSSAVRGEEYPSARALADAVISLYRARAIAMEKAARLVEAYAGREAENAR